VRGESGDPVVTVFAGTSGYSYAEWKGPFYPARLPATGMLRFYAEHLPAVEINNTFYRLPKASVLEAWSDQVPAGFRFAIKASRRITHEKRLKEVADETDYFLRTTATLGSRLGPLLFQLPPNLRKDTDRLARFCDLLPDGTRATMEFRHPSWLDEEVFSLLRSSNLALCIADGEGDDTGTEARIVATASWGYLRLRRPDYGQADLERWAEHVRSQAWDDAYVFFKHEDEGAGPRLAASFLTHVKGSKEQTP
jgi:uncharacterized protein YecE (DUF72 family)